MRRPFRVIQIGNRYRVWSDGISGGFHILFETPSLWPQSPYPEWISADVFGTVEMIQWRDVRHHNLGFTVQFDLGALAAINLGNLSQTFPSPLFNTSIGLAW